MLGRHKDKTGRRPYSPSKIATLFACVLLSRVIFASPAEHTECPDQFVAADKSRFNDVIAVVRSYKNNLDNMGLGERAKQTLVLDCLRAHLAEPSSEHVYWQQHRNQFMAERAAQRHELRFNLVAGLTKLYGIYAQSLTLFEEIFLPVAEDAGYLSAADQEVLSEHRLDGMLRQLTQRTTKPFEPKDFDQRRISLAMTPPALSPEGWMEHELRNSPVSQGVLTSGVAWTEALFRDAHQLLQDAYRHGQHISPEELQKTNTNLARLLGADRALRVHAALDPRFEKFRTQALQLGLTEAQTYQAFKIIADTEFEMWRSTVDHEDDQESAHLEMRLAAAQGEQELIDYVGQTQAVELRQALMAAVPPSAYMQ